MIACSRIVVLAFSYLLSGRYWGGVALLTSVATVIRLEVALLAVPIALALVVHRRMSFGAALSAGMVGGFGSLGTSPRPASRLKSLPAPC